MELDECKLEGLDPPDSIENISSSSAELDTSVPNQNEIYKEFLVAHPENSTNAYDLNIRSDASVSFAKPARANKCNDPRLGTERSNCAKLILNEMETAMRKPVATATSQLSLNDVLSAYKQNLSAKPGPYEGSEKAHSFFTPSHSLEEIEALEWPYLLSVNRLDIIYNKNNHCENLEALFKPYVEKFIGAETSSSFNFRKSSERTIKQLR